MRPDLVVHALACCPADVEAVLSQSRELQRLVWAYGLEQRVTFDESRTIGELDSIPETLAGLVESLAQGEPAALSASGSRALQGQRVAIVTNLPMHYRVPLFNAMNDLLQAEGASFRVFFLAKRPSDRGWMQAGEPEFDHEFLRGLDLSAGRGRRLLPLDLGRRLRAFAPTVAIVGGFSPLVAGRVARAARRQRFAFGVWSGEIATRSTAQSARRAASRRRLLYQAAFGIAYGSMAGEYLRSIAPELPIVHGRNTTPLPGIAEDAPAATVRLLSVARLERGKRLDLLVDALALLPDAGVELTFVGAGPLDAELRKRAGAERRIRFVGAVPSSEVGAFYERSDVFVFPSEYDVFGLSLVEAMGAGLAVVTSRRIGAAADLAVDGVNCLLVDQRDSPAAWAAAIDQLVRDPDLRRSLGTAAARTVRGRWTLEHAADAMLAGVRLGASA